MNTPADPIINSQQRAPIDTPDNAVHDQATAHRNSMDLADLTRRYARYSRSAGGIAAIIGGVLCIAMFVLGLTIELSPTLRLMLACAPLLWIVSKEVLTLTYYQRFGRVEQRISDKERRAHLGFTLFIALVSLIILVTVLVKHGLEGLTWPLMGSLGVTVFMPFAVWRWMWSNSDFIVGVSMLCQSAVILNGSHYSLNFLGYYMLGAGVLSIVMGIKEHLEYQRISAKLFGSPTSNDGSAESSKSKSNE